MKVSEVPFDPATGTGLGVKRRWFGVEGAESARRGLGAAWVRRQANATMILRYVCETLNHGSL
jgi:hypothetical protein